MEALFRLLSLRDSPVTEAVRQGLRGLSRQLWESLQQTPYDPGAAAGKDLLDELAGLLQEEQPAEPAAERVPDCEVRWGRGVALSRLRREIEGSRHLQERLGAIDLQGAGDRELWGEIQRLFLRLNPAEAQRWSQRAAGLARQAGAVAQTQDVQCLCDDVEEGVYPGLAGAVSAPGLQLSASAPVHRLLAAEGGTPDWAGLTAGISFFLCYMESDPALHHALESVRPHGVHRLVGGQRDGFVKELILRYQRVKVDTADPVAALRAWIALDEAIHSLTHVPAAASLSWWRQHQQRMRQRLDAAADKARRAGHRVHLRWLAGNYRQVRNYTANDWGMESGGSPGEVVACLRVYAEIDGQAFPGRVIYREY